MDKTSKLYTPIKLGKFELKSRVEIGPHGSALHEPGGRVGDKLLAFLRNQARSGAGLVTIGSGNINREAQAFAVAHPANPFLVGNYRIASEMMHQYNTKISMQLFPGHEMLTPSDIVVREATHESIRELCSQYADAAFNMMNAGFDFVMIHGAHGNGPSMFFSPEFNHRTDEYGGSLENRARFGIEVLEAIREKCGDGIGIEYRISAEEMTEKGASLEETIEYAKLIQDYVDVLHVSRGLLEETSHYPYVFAPIYFPRGMNVEYAQKFKEALDIPVNVVGGLDLDTAEAAVDSGAVDMATIVRGFFAEPNLVTKVLRDQQEDIRPCIRCNVCIDQTHARLWEVRCSVNPLLGRETQFPMAGYPAPKSKKVVLVGGGPANLEAARTASKRGHKVVLFEREAELGGKLLCASASDLKKDLRKYLDWSVRTVMQDPNIDVRLNTKATPELIRTEAPDAVIIAIGGEPIIPKFTATGTDKVVWVGDVELGRAQTGQKVLLAGGGFTGLEAALDLARKGKDVTVVDMIPESALGTGGTAMNTEGLLQLLAKSNVKFCCETRIKDITEDGMIVIDKDGNERTMECDTVVVSFGIRKDPSAVAELANVIPETYVIGDCSPVGGTVWPAVRSGFDMAMEL